MKARAMCRAAILVCGLCTLAPAPGSTQVLETETARLMRRGGYELGTAVEIQTSREGTERAVPVAVEYGATDRFALLVEPVGYTAIRPRRGLRATGAGDLEITAIGLLRDEAGALPALALAAEVKLPTARNTLIGTGKADYAAYLIASRRVGPLDLHGNLGYTILGRPAGVALNNIVSGAVAAEWRLNPRFELFGEALGNTSATPEGGPENPSTTTPTAAEVVGGEVVGTVGLGVFATPHLLVSLGVSYDNNQATLFRPGITYRWR